MQQNQYESFLKSKALVANEQGFTVTDSDLHPSLFGHQRVTVQWAIELGRKGWGAELNPLYFDIAAGYCKDAEVKASMPTLFEVAAD